MSPRIRNWLLVFAALVTLGAFTGCGVTASSFNSGYADIDTPRHRGMTRDTSLSLGPMVMRFASNHVDDDPATKALLESIDGVRVSVYELQENIDRPALVADMERAACDLANDDWQAIVQVREDDENVHILLKESDSTIVGVAIMVADEEEFVFVNVMGEISPEVLLEMSEEMPGGESLALAAAEIF